MAIILKNATEEIQLEDIRKLYESSFPKSEKKPFNFMRKKQKEGYFDMLAIEEEEGKFCGLAIMLLAGGWALLDYLAIDPSCQGTGLGSRTLEALQERYGKEQIVVEIESTIRDAEGSMASEAMENGGFKDSRKAEEAYGMEAFGAADGIGAVQAAAGPTGENGRERLRRKAFYLRNGMVPMDFLVDLFGVEMEVLTFGSQITFEQYHGIYAEVLPEEMAEKVRRAPEPGRTGEEK